MNNIKFNTSFRLQEYGVLLYRIALAYFFYFIARVLFILYNHDLVAVNSLAEALKLCWYGMLFDNTAIMYVNLLFILLSIIPALFNTQKSYQRVLFYIYLITNTLAYATSFIDLIFYRFTHGRMTLETFDMIKNEENGEGLLARFFVEYWSTFLLFILAIWLWRFLFLKKSVKSIAVKQYKRSTYFIASSITMPLIIGLMVILIRSTGIHSPPLAVNDATICVQNLLQTPVVLNTPFSIIRTINKHRLKPVNFVSKEVIEQTLIPIKTYRVDSSPMDKKNVVIFILESFGKEYVGAFNKGTTIPNYKSYTPFLDSLAQHSLMFTKGFANARLSMHAFPAIVAGIPTFDVVFLSTFYVNQNTESLISCLNSVGYNTSFFHNVWNGSMGFLGYSGILGFDHYYGKTEYDKTYPNHHDFDGTWGPWDEPFLQYVKTTLDKKTSPFMATIFTVSSHDPFKVPEQYIKKFPKGDVPIHRCIKYADYALKKFFEAAKQTDWFDNTLFVITADHTNQNEIFYDEYRTLTNRLAIPILLYTPNGDLLGKKTTLAEQIDIYPTVLDYLHYPQPFRSWGRSLLRDTPAPCVMSYINNTYVMMKNGYVLLFNGEKSIGLYAENDKGMKHNLLKIAPEIAIALEQHCKAFIQDYRDRIANRKLSGISNFQK